VRAHLCADEVLVLKYSPDIELLLGSAAHDAIPAAPSPAAGDLPVAGGGDRALVGGAYEGARIFDKEIALWQPGLGSADMDLLPEKPFIDARVRDSFRNDAYVANGGELQKDNIVGASFLLNAKPATKALAQVDKTFDESWESEMQEEVETIFTLLAESPNNWLDVTRVNTLTEMTRLAVGIHSAAGEVLATAAWMRDGRPFNTALQMIDLDRLSNPFGQWNNRNLRDGVVKTDYGMPVGYQIRNGHPADFNNFGTLDYQKWTLVPAAKPWGRLQTLHILEQNRVDQSRGVSGIVSMLKELRITKKFRDVVLQNAVVNATYAASIESDLPSDQVMAQLGGGNVSEAAYQEAITQYGLGFLGAIGQYAKGSKNMAIDGVKIPHLFPGTKLQMRPAGQGGPLGNDFEQSLLRYIAAGLGVSYEQLSKDYSQSNYSSVRAAMTETWKTMQGRKRRVADRFAGTAYRLWLEEAINKNALSTIPVSKKDLFYTGGKLNLRFDAIAGCEWVGASRGQIDELKETQAAIQRILFGLSTWEDELGRLGKDWRKVFAQIQREQTDRETRGILQNIQSDMANATTGAVSTDEPGEGTTAEGAAGAPASGAKKPAPKGAKK
jgi:lambda family phage portal protein